MTSARFMIVAGEVSGDRLAAELVDALKTEWRQTPSADSSSGGPLLFFGAGGDEMRSVGVDLEVDLVAHSVVGLTDVFRGYRRFHKIYRQLLRRAREQQPDCVILVDFSGFNRRLAASLRKQAASRASSSRPMRIVYFVSPQVWASRPRRADSLARDCDCLLSILPFEKEWYAKRAPHLRVEFVGHPLVDRYPSSRSDGAQVGSPGRAHLVLLLPGSRRAELIRHLPLMLEAAHRIRREAEVEFLLVLPNQGLKSLVPQTAQSWPHLRVQVGALDQALREATLAIASTGTVTLECALAGVPTVALYRTSWFTYQVARWLVTVPFLAMPNILAGEQLLPELIQHHATPARIADQALALWREPSRRAAISQRLRQLTATLGPPGATRRAAQVIAELLRRNVRAA